VPPTPVPPTPIIETLTANGEPATDRAAPERTTSERPGASTERLSAASTPKPTVAQNAPMKDTVVLSGRGDMRTKPFNLSGGGYTVAWQATPSGSSATFRARMVPTTAAGGESLAETKLDSRERGETELYDVKAGPHYLEITMTGDWIVAIVPQGEDATAALVAGLTAASPAPRLR
jgi:hypothetical protein